MNKSQGEIMKDDNKKQVAIEGMGPDAEVETRVKNGSFRSRVVK